MGLLGSEDWMAKWIGYDAEPPEIYKESQTTDQLSLKGGKWIWFDEGDPIKNAPIGTRFFRNSFEIASDKTIKQARFALLADNQATLFVNGKEAGQVGGWQSVNMIDVTDKLAAGNNTLAIAVANVGDAANPAGLTGKLMVEFEAEGNTTVLIDNSWKVSDIEQDDWQMSGFDDDAWPNAIVIAQLGDSPWGQPSQGRLVLPPPPYLRKSFVIDKSVKRAVVYASALGLYLAEREPGVPVWRRALPLTAAVLIEVALVLTMSRLGIAAAALAGLLTIALFTQRRAAWGAFAGVLCLVALNVLLGISPVLERYSLLFEDGRGRLQAWSMSLPMVLDYPIFGSGGASYRQLFALYQEPSLSGWWLNAHNDYLTVVIECGLLALGGLIAVAVIFFRRTTPMRVSPVRTDSALAAAGFLAVTAELIHSVGDYPLRQPANLLVFAAVAGVVYGRANHGGQVPPEGPYRPWRRVPACAGDPHADRRTSQGESEDASSIGKAVGYRLTLAGVLCVAVIPVLALVHRAETLKAEAAELVSAGSPRPEHFDRAITLLESAARTDPWDGEARYEAARLRVGMLSAGARPEEARKLTEQAIDDAHSGLQVSPLDPRPYYLLGILTWAPGSEETSDRMMATALRLGRAWHDVSYNVGAYFLRRWRLEVKSRPGFGLARWEAGKGSEFLRSASKALSLAVRSPGGIRTVELVLGQPLFSGEIDLLLNPDPEIEVVLARGLARRGRHAEAELRFARALQAGKGLPKESLAAVHAAYAQSLLGLGRIDDALDEFKRSLASASPEELGDCVQALGRIRVPEDAASEVADWWRALSAEMEGLDGEPAFLLALGRAELVAGRVESGTEHLLGYAEATRDASAYAELAARALARGEPELAVTMASEAARLEGKAEHQLLLSHAFRNAGCDAEALSALRRALALAPRNLRAARGLAQIELAAGRPEEAARLWEQFLRSGGDQAAGHEGLADVYSAVLDDKRAVEELSLALDARPGDLRLMKKLQGLVTTQGKAD